ncbi:Carbohydrate sulfotransferase 15 [Myotis brandtii]|uniref:Carbohydrate sulfotransferase 15 n=1 Tax=Myotis brandtii TaxID=109478 RepID=S7Q7I0_MYOBR|nr:Carbohydrate sulfotransferase 15 [Myotis brandtii]
MGRHGAQPDPPTRTRLKIVRDPYPAGPTLVKPRRVGDTASAPLAPVRGCEGPPAGNLSSAKDAPGLRSVIDSIAARIAFTARQLPGTDDLRRQEPHMFAVIPRKFLPSSRSPCWYEEFTGHNTSDPYLTNSYALYSKRFRATFDVLRKAFWGHLAHAAGRHYRLRCLPRFYIIGQPKCGTTDL